MKTNTPTDLKTALAAFHDRAVTLQLLIEERQAPRRRRPWRWLSHLPATMVSMVALGVALYVAISPATPTVRLEAATPKSLVSTRLFALFPDGRVELSDQWNGRRQYQWDGRLWRSVDLPPIQTVEAGPGPRPAKALAVDRSAVGPAIMEGRMSGRHDTR